MQLFPQKASLQSHRNRLVLTVAVESNYGPIRHPHCQELPRTPDLAL